MRRQPRHQDGRRPFGPPRTVVVLLLAELIAVGVLAALGVSAGTIVKYAGLPVGLTLGLLAPTVQDIGRRKPRLVLRAAQARPDGVVPAPARRPWPYDVERIVANELADARETLKVGGASMRALGAGLGPFVRRPGPADHERAKEAFAQELDDFERELRAWLAAYGRASRERTDTFLVTFRLENSPSGAHADDVLVALELPTGAVLIEQLPEIAPPPARPSYRPPLPQLYGPVSQALDYTPLFDRPLVGIGSIGSLSEAFVRTSSYWTANGGECLERDVGDLQPGRSVALGEPLLIQVPGPGRHELRWTVRTPSLPRAATGTLVLDLPLDPDRPSVGRLHGILEYPDVPIVDDELESSECGDDDRVARRDARSSDPLLTPPSPEPVEPAEASEPGDAGTLDVLEFLRELDRQEPVLRWRALGLDPSDDGPPHIEVRRATDTRPERSESS